MPSERGSTATGSPMRIDDETAGIPLVSTAPGAFAGELITARGCYICKQDYATIHHFYDALCPACAEFNLRKRTELADLTGTTIETAIRVMSRWSKQNLVHTEKDGFLIVNRQGLESLSFE